MASLSNLKDIEKLMKEKPTNLKPWEEDVYREGFLAGQRAAREEGPLHPAWQTFMKYCSFDGELKGYGTITALKIQHGLPERGERVQKIVIFNEKGVK